jgi:hypothetical protein
MKFTYKELGLIITALREYELYLHDDDPATADEVDDLCACFEDARVRFPIKDETD